MKLLLWLICQFALVLSVQIRRYRDPRVAVMCTRVVSGVAISGELMIFLSQFIDIALRILHYFDEWILVLFLGLVREVVFFLGVIKILCDRIL